MPQTLTTYADRVDEVAEMERGQFSRRAHSEPHRYRTA
jgi:hypothetical protein